MTALRPDVANRPTQPGRAHPVVREAAAADESALAALLDADPFVNAVVRARLAGYDPAARPDLRYFGAPVLAVEQDGLLVGGAGNGGNLLPFGAGRAWVAALAADVARRTRACSAIVGRREVVAELWAILAPHRSAPRLIRAAQPLLVCDRVAADRVDPGVRLAVATDVDAYLPAAAAMFAAELAQSPFLHMSRSAYRQRLEAMIRAGRAVVLTDAAGQVVFKAELAAVTPSTCQIQGVWLRPDLRGHGLASAAMAGVLQHALRLAPTASLYVNDFNLAARRLYAGLGMTQVATLSTVLF